MIAICNKANKFECCKEDDEEPRPDYCAMEMCIVKRFGIKEK